MKKRNEESKNIRITLTEFRGIVRKACNRNTIDCMIDEEGLWFSEENVEDMNVKELWKRLSAYFGFPIKKMYADGVGDEADVIIESK